MSDITTNQQVDISQALEAILFLAEEPVAELALADALQIEESDLLERLDALQDELLAQRRGFVLRQVAGGWRFYSAPDAAPAIERFVSAGRVGRLTQAALETLAIVAYKQPIGRHAISDIRGVNADGAVRTLMQRGYLDEVGREDTPGQPILYGTSATFLEQLGLDTIDELAPLTDFLPEAPAPDEPQPGTQRAARRTIRDDGELPSTGKSRWAPVAEPDADPTLLDGGEAASNEEPEAGEGKSAMEEAAARAQIARQDRKAQEEEMAELSASLERAATNALRQLREAEAAQSRDDAEQTEPTTMPVDSKTDVIRDSDSPPNPTT